MQKIHINANNAQTYAKISLKYAEMRNNAHKNAQKYVKYIK